MLLFLSQFLRLMDFIMWNHFHRNCLPLLKILLYSQFFPLKTKLNQPKTEVLHWQQTLPCGHFWLGIQMSTTFYDRYILEHCSHLLHLSSPRDGQQACSHPAPVARQLWRILSVKWTSLGASLRRTDENSQDPCCVPSALLHKEWSTWVHLEPTRWFASLWADTVL